MTVTKLIKIILALFLSCIAFVCLYMITAFTLSRMTVKREQKTEGSIPIYILTNGVHTDIVMPVKTSQVDWNTIFHFNNTIGKDSSLPYIGIGWGDKGFYLNTPTWDDLTFTTAFNAVFGLSTTAIHATYHLNITESNTCKKMLLTNEQYQRLIIFIKSRTQTNANGLPIYIKTNANYGNEDAFYEAKGNYNMFYTCNTWSNNALKSCGQKACLWTPFQSGIFYQYK